MKTLSLITLFIVIAILSFGQTVKVQGGMSYSTLDWKLDTYSNNFLNDQLTGYSFLVGIDYAENKLFNLSTNIGMIRKGGTDNISSFSVQLPDGAVNSDNTIDATLDYLTVNTTIDIKYGLKQYGSPYVSIGPRFDYLVTYSEVFDELDELGDLNKYNFGLNLGFGYKYEIFDVVFGLRADYYANFMKIAEWDTEIDRLGGSIQDQTYTIMATIGYKLK